MLDWPNLLAGAVLGFALALIPWMLDRRRARRSRLADVRAQWASAAKQVEIIMNRPDATSGDLYLERVKHPVDHWRSVLGPDDFRVLERLENSYQQVEGWARRLAAAPANNELVQRVQKALEAQRDARVAFANVSRGMQSTSYAEVVDREELARLRRDYLSHPVHTWKRERHNRRVRKEAGL